MKPYKQRPGEFEIRILPDGRVLVPAPDEALLNLADVLNQPGAEKSRSEKERRNGRAKTGSAKTRSRAGRGRKNG